MTRTFRRPFAFQRPASARVGRWYEIKNLSTEMADVTIYDEIGGWGVTASDFSRDLQAITARGITLHINSPGGDVFDGLAILNTLRQHPANVHVIIDGVAASAASFIAMAGDTIQVAPNAMIMIHEASGLVMGNAQDMSEMAALLDKTSANIASVYAQRAGGTPEDWRAAMRAETWYSDQEAVDAGLADGILGDDTRAAQPSAKAHTTPQGIRNTVVAVHHTATVDEPWDAGEEERNLPSPLTVATAKKVYAWYDGSAVENGELPKDACSFPHHEVSDDGTPGAANLSACRNGLARLTEAHIPESDRDGVRAHLQAHLDDGRSGDRGSTQDNSPETVTDSFSYEAFVKAMTAAKEATARG